MRRAALVAALLALALAGCADPAPDPGPPTASGSGSGSSSDGLVEGDAFVLEDRSHGPELCLGGVATSLPPQCGGVPIRGWDWEAVEGEEARSGTTWGEYHVAGSYDGDSFAVSEVSAPGAPAPDDREIGTPCPVSDGGGTAPDVSMAGEDDLLAAGRAAEAEADSGGFWIDYVEEPVDDETPVSPGGIILNASFTGDVERHTAELRELWGGPLCVSQVANTQRDLERIQREIGDGALESLGLETTWSATYVFDNVVEIGVVVATDEDRAAVDALYGEGTVELVPALTPVA